MRDRLRLGAPSRRQFLIGAAATTLLAACGDDDDVATSSEMSDASSSDPELSVVRFYGSYFLAGAASRVPFGLADTDGILPIDASPDEVAVSVEAPDGSVVAADLAAALRADGLPRGYYAFEFTPEVPGFYNVTVSTDAGELPSQVQVAPADDPILGKLVKPGDPMPAIQTPTVQDPRGVTPICTRDPICPLHDRTVAEVVGTAPMVLMVATPAFCQTSVCGPVLDIMLEQTGDFPGVTFLHADVYRNPEENQQPVVPEDFAPVTTELGLPFEPVLYSVGPDGIVRDRLDYIFDGSEINETVRRLVG